MTSPRNSQISPKHMTNQPLPGSLISKHSYVTCHIECQHRSLPPWLRPPPPHKGCPNLPQLPAPPSRGKEKKGPVHHPHPPQPRLKTLNTSYHSTIRGLARRSETPKSMPSCIPTPTRPVNSGRGGTTSTPSHQATCTLTLNSPPLTRKLPPAQVRAARAKAKLGSLPLPNKSRARSPLLLKRGRPPSQVPNEASLLLASPRPLTQTLSPLPLPSLTLPLASSENQTASSPLASLLLSTLAAQSP